MVRQRAWAIARRAGAAADRNAWRCRGPLSPCRHLQRRFLECATPGKAVSKAKERKFGFRAATRGARRVYAQDSRPQSVLAQRNLRILALVPPTTGYAWRFFFFFFFSCVCPILPICWRLATWIQKCLYIGAFVTMTLVFMRYEYGPLSVCANSDLLLTLESLSDGLPSPAHTGRGPDIAMAYRTGQARAIVSYRRFGELLTIQTFATFNYYSKRITSLLPSSMAVYPLSRP